MPTEGGARKAVRAGRSGAQEPAGMSRGPLVRTRIADVLRRHILSGCEPGSRLAPERDLAEKLDVSRGTLRAALKELELEGFLQRRQGGGTFVLQHPTLLPGSKPTPTGNLGLAIHLSFRELQQASFDALVLDGIRSRAGEEGWDLLVFGGKGPSKAPDLPDHFLNKIDGLMIFEVFNADYIRAVARRLPTVLVDTEVTGSGIPCVVLDNESGAYQAVKHLADIGHRRIAFLGEGSRASPTADPAWQERHHGFLRACVDLALGPPNDILDCGRSAAGVPAVLGEWLDRRPPADLPTAIVCSDDALAFAAAEVLKQRGMDVPRDMSLVGFGNRTEGERRGRMVPATTLGGDFVGLGRRAVDLMATMLAGKDPPVKRLTIPMSLIVRASTAPPRAR